MALTGGSWSRKSWTGRPVLLVEERPGRFRSSASRPRWRDAKLLDSAEPESRGLMAIEQARRTGARATPRPPRGLPERVATA